MDVGPVVLREHGPGSYDVAATAVRIDHATMMTSHAGMLYPEIPVDRLTPDRSYWLVRSRAGDHLAALDANGRPFSLTSRDWYVSAENVD